MLVEVGIAMIYDRIAKPMNVRDWRDADPADTQWLYAREQDYWVRELAWDASKGVLMVSSP